MPYVTFVPQAPMGESADPGIFVQGTHVPAPLVERSGIWIKTAGSAILLQQNYRLSTCDAPLWLDDKVLVLAEAAVADVPGDEADRVADALRFSRSLECNL